MKFADHLPCSIFGAIIYKNNLTIFGYLPFLNHRAGYGIFTSGFENATSPAFQATSPIRGGLRTATCDLRTAFPIIPKGYTCLFFDA